MSSLADIRTAYRNNLISASEPDMACRVAGKGYDEPLTEKEAIHGDKRPDLTAYNLYIATVGVDLAGLNTQLVSASLNLVSMIDSIKTSLASIDNQIQQESDRLEDLNLLTGYDDGMDCSMQLTKTDLTGTFDVTGTTYHAAETAKADVLLSVTSISGNGYEGNKYVWNQSYVQATQDTGSQAYITDSSALTQYEYSRLSCNGAAPTSFVNSDSEPVRCVLVLTGDIAFNQMVLSLGNTVWLEAIETSDDGTTWTTVEWKSRQIMAASARFADPAYTCGSGLIAFAPTTHVRLHFMSTELSVTKLAYDYNGATVFLDNVNRSVIAIGSIQAYSAVYANEAIITSGELLTAEADRIAIFVNEFIPEHFAARQYIFYSLIVNGVEHSVVPINSQADGKKIIKLNHYDTQDVYAIYLTESIKNASLKVVLWTPNNQETPYLANLKVCYGKEAASV